MLAFFLKKRLITTDRLPSFSLLYKYFTFGIDKRNLVVYNYIQNGIGCG